MLKTSSTTAYTLASKGGPIGAQDPQTTSTAHSAHTRVRNGPRLVHTFLPILPCHIGSAHPVYKGHVSPRRVMSHVALSMHRLSTLSASERR